MLACPGRVRAATPPPTGQDQTVAAVDASVAASSNAMWSAAIRRLSKATLRDAPAAAATAVQGPSTNGQRSVRTVLPSQAAATVRTGAPARQSARSAQTMDSMSTCVRAGSGLIGWWQAENNANDSAGTHHGQLVNGADCDVGMVEYGFLFEGVDESVEIPSPSGLATPSFTIETWVYPAEQVEWQAFIFGQAYGRQLVLWPGEGGWAVSLFVTDPEGNFVGVDSTAVIPFEAWSHLAATYDGTYLKLYINGVFNAQRESGLSEIGVTACPFSIGGINNSCASGQYFNGLIDEVSLYDRALFPGEINAIWQAGAAGKCKSPPVCVTCPDTAVSWWAAEGDGADAFRRNTGTLQNNVGFAAGMTGQAFSLDGGSKAVKFPPPNSLATTSFSIEAWVHPTDQVAWQAFIFGQSYGRQLIVRSGTRGLSVAFVISTDPWTFYEVDSSAEIPLGQWTHLVGTWDSTSSALSLYINGALDQQAALSVVPWDSGCAFHIGGVYDPTGDCAYVDQFFYGLIDETALYGAALSPEQVQTLYNAGTAGKCNIPGSWLAQYFGVNYQTDPNAALNADPDRDGLTNLEEYQNGTDPTNSDTDGDLLSDGPEVHLYGSDPTNPNTYSVQTDAVYLLSGAPGSPNPLRIDYIIPGSLLAIAIDGTPGGAPDGTPCDLYVERIGISSPPEWRLYACGSPGQTVFHVPEPSFNAQWRVASAFDQDGDGVTDGAEALFCHSGVNNPRSDGVMPDAWKVEWGLLPTSTVDPDGPNSNPDQDTFNAYPFTNQQEMQSGTDPWKAESVAPRTVVTVSADTATATRPGNGHAAIPAAFRITRSDASTGGFTVKYCVGGTGSYGADYTLLPAPSPEEYEFTVVFAAGEFSKVVQVVPAAGSGSKTVTVGLVPPWPSYIQGNPSAWPYVVDPKHDRASAAILDAPSSISAVLAVAVHDSTRNRMAGILADTWRYGVMPDSVKEALRSDGTPFVTLHDDFTLESLVVGTPPNATPKYPIVISFATERITDTEAAALRDYVDAGGFLFVGSSALTKYENGTPRGDFALAAEMGITCAANTWVPNTYLRNFENPEHRLLAFIPAGQLTWRMPWSSEEVSWGYCDPNILEHRLYPQPLSHKIWQVSLTAQAPATTIAHGDEHPYLLAKQYNNHGYFIYDAALQPLIGHGGNSPGMYAYSVFRKAIEWAFESRQLPIAKLSPWPYDYNAALIIRHDLEHFTSEIERITESAEYERTHEVAGDYYLPTGVIRYNQTAIDGLAKAVEAGASIGPHNGGLQIPYACATSGDTWHWGLDEVLDLSLAPSGRGYAMDSLSGAFQELEMWLKAPPNSPRAWVACWFNATRDASYEIQEELNIRVAGEQKLTPFPHWTVSTKTDGKRFTFLSEPVSDWFVNGQVAQSLEPWQDPAFHSSTTLRAGIDAYYNLGALINFYSHTLSTGLRWDGRDLPLAREYIDYSKAHPNLWAANALSIYDWWLKRSTVQSTATYHPWTNGRHVATVTVTGAQDEDTAVEVQLPATGSLASGTLAVAPVGTPFRQVGNIVKVKVGTGIPSVAVYYGLNPAAREDGYYVAKAGELRTVPGTQGVLQNDTSPRGVTLEATETGTHLDGLSLSSDGGFTYQPAAGPTGLRTFTYRAWESITSISEPATASIMVAPSGTYLAEDFSDPALVAWLVRSGVWSVANGAMVAGPNTGGYGTAYQGDTTWTDYSVEARIKFQPGAYGGGIGGRVNPITGARYGLWIFPEDSPSGFPKTLALIKFWDWETWGYNDAERTFMHTPVSLTSVGTDWHTLKLTFLPNGQIEAYYGSQLQFSIADTDNPSGAHPPLLNGSVSVDTWTLNAGSAYRMSVDYLLVKP